MLPRYFFLAHPSMRTARHFLPTALSDAEVGFSAVSLDFTLCDSLPPDTSLFIAELCAILRALRTLYSLQGSRYVPMGMLLRLHCRSLLTYKYIYFPPCIPGNVYMVD